MLGKGGAAEVADSIVDDINPPKVNFRDSSTARDNKLGRHVVEAIDDSGTPVGKIEWREPPAGEPGVAHIGGVNVEEPHQGRGIGSALRRHVMDDMTQRGYTDVTSDISSPAGAKLAARSGATFETRVGDPLTTDEAMEEAALGFRGRGPKSRTKLTPEDTRAGAESPPTTKTETAAPARAVEDKTPTPIAEGDDLISLRAEVDELTRAKAAGEMVGKRLGTAKRKLAQAETRGALEPVARKLSSETGAAKIPGGEPEPKLGAQRPRAEAEADAARTPEDSNLAQEAAADVPTPTPKTPKQRFKKGDTLYNKKGQPITFVKHGGKDNPGMVWAKETPKAKPKLVPRKGLSHTSPTATPLPIEPHKIRFRKGVESPVDKLGSLLRTSKRLKGEQRKIAYEIAEKQRGAAHGALEHARAKPGRKPGEATAAFKAQLRGKRNLPIMEPPRQHFNDDELIELEELLRKRYPTRDHDYINASDAMDKLMNGYPLAKYERALLKGIVPDDALEHANKLATSLAKQIRGEVFDVALNIQRLFQVGVGDVGGILRQGFLATSHPRHWSKNAVRTVRFLFDGKYTDEVATAIRKDADFDTLDDLGLDLEGVKHQLGEAAKTTYEENLTYGEGKIMAWIGSKVPIIKQTTRSFRMGLASLRFAIAKEHLGNMRRIGADKEALEGMANFVNRLTGRGTLGPAEKYAPVLNQVFYAARLQAAHVQVPFYIFHKSSYVRKLAARSLISAAGLAGGTLLLAKAAGADIEIDPRSANFGKIKMGSTRIDITGGFAPLIRFVDRVATEAAGGKGIKTDIGDFRDMDIRVAIEDFVRGKLAPGISTVADVWKGENFQGELLRADWATARRELVNRFAPLMIQSAVEAYQDSGWDAVPFALAEGVGMGTMTYTPANAEIFQLLSDDMEAGIIDLDDYPELDGRGPRIRSELHPADQREFEKRHADTLSAIEKKFKLQKQDALSTTYEVARETGEAATQRVSEMESAVADGSMTLEDFRLGMADVKSDKRASTDIIDKLLEAQGVEDDERPTTPGLLQDLYDYGQVFAEFPNTDIPSEKDAMFDAIEEFRAEIGPQRELALDNNMSLAFKDSPLYNELEADKEKIDASGYFDRQDAVWEDVRDIAGIDLEEDYYAYRRKIEREKGKQALDRDPWIRIAERRSQPFLRRWILTHPEELSLVIKWGYKEESDLDAAILRSRGIEY